MKLTCRLRSWLRPIWMVLWRMVDSVEVNCRQCPDCGRCMRHGAACKNNEAY